MEEQSKPVKKRPVALIVTMALVGLAGIVGLVYFQVQNKVMDYNYTLYLTAKGLNLTCPREVAKNVRLDSAAAKFDKQLWYYYTLTDMTRDDDTIEEFCEFYEKSLIENLRDNKEMAEFGKNNVMVGFEIRDKNSELMCSTMLSPDKYYKP